MATTKLIITDQFETLKGEHGLLYHVTLTLVLSVFCALFLFLNVTIRMTGGILGYSRTSGRGCV